MGEVVGNRSIIGLIHKAVEQNKLFTGKWEIHLRSRQVSYLIFSSSSTSQSAHIDDGDRKALLCRVKSNATSVQDRIGPCES